MIKLPTLKTSENEEIVFDADRDNDGKGINPDSIVEALKKIRLGLQ